MTLPMQDGCGQAPCVQTPAVRVQGKPRAVGLDVLRGAAVLLMIVDHVAYVT